MEWWNGGMAEWRGMAEKGNDGKGQNGGMAGWRDGGIYHAVFMYRTAPAEWRNGYLTNLPDKFTVHADEDDDDTDTFKSFIVLTSR